MSNPAPADAPAFRPADLGRRFYAFAIDRLIAWSISAGAAWAAWYLLPDRDQAWVAAGLGVAVLVGAVLAALLGGTGLSPGKAALGLRVVHHGTGGPIGVGAALVRSLTLGVSTLPTFGLGAATLAWTAVMDPGRQRRGWHDHVTSAFVVDVRPVPEVVGEDEGRAPGHLVNLTASRLVPAVPQPPAPVRAGVAVGADAPAADTLRWRVAFDTGESFVVEGLALVGRHPEPPPGEPARHVVPLASSDLSLSKTHAQLHLSGDGVLVVMDRGSTNGSMLERQGVSRELNAGRPATLVDGDVVRFGDRRMQVRREG